MMSGRPDRREMDQPNDGNGNKDDKEAVRVNPGMAGIILNGIDHECTGH